MIFNLPVDNDGAFNYIIVVQLMTLNLIYKISLSKNFLYENVLSKNFLYKNLFLNKFSIEKIWYPKNSPSEILLFITFSYEF